MQDPEISRLSTQLAWSVQEIYPRGRLELMIRDQRVRVFDVEDQRRRNPIYPVESQATPYCLLGGVVHRVGAPGELATEPLPIDAGSNHDLAWAALARHRGAVLTALVTTNGRLLVGSGGPLATKFAQSSRPVGREARPVWLRGFDRNTVAGLVVVDGQLNRFGLDAALVPLQLREAPGTVKAVSAALDGHRIAFIAGDRLFVASLDADREIVEVRPVPVSLHRPTAVAWIDDSGLVVAGQNHNGRTALVNVTVDGGSEQTGEDLGLARVDHLAAYPFNPVSGVRPEVMYEANGAVWRSSSPVSVDQLQGVDPASVGNVRPRAPAFLY